MAVAPFRNRIVGSDNVPPTDLLANPNNWRTHPGRQRDALRGALGTVGWVQQVIVNTTTGHLVDGHARIEESISRGEATVPVVYVELTAEEEALILATFDPIGAMATQDDARLTELLADLDVEDAGLRALLADMTPEDVKVGLTDPDDVPDLGEETHIKRGDIFALGDHRLMCGDATDAKSVASLGAGVADLLWADPPYGVDFQALRRSDKLTNDETPAAARQVTEAALRLASCKIAYVCCDWRSLGETAAAMEAADLAPKSCIVWDKGRGTQNLDRFAKRHEFVLYSGPFGGEKTVDDDVWEIPRDFAPDHPTPKPVELVARSIRHSNATAIYDPFSGSGTTIIAAEQLSRRCYAMEIDPRYVAVAIERWEKFTGRKAERV